MNRAVRGLEQQRSGGIQAQTPARDRSASSKYEAAAA